MLIHLKKSKNATQYPENGFMQLTENVLWTMKYVKSGLPGFMLEISHWMILYGWVDTWKLIVIKIKTLLKITQYEMMLGVGGIANILKIAKVFAPA